ncbi:MAG: hypothetical protein GY765_24000 [bacterium]|nr:hypothetical protein [bacterium]
MFYSKSAAYRDRNERFGFPINRAFCRPPFSGDSLRLSLACHFIIFLACHFIIFPMVSKWPRTPLQEKERETD